MTAPILYKKATAMLPIRQQPRSEILYLMSCHPATFHALLEMPQPVASRQSNGTFRGFRRFFAAVVRWWSRKVRHQSR